MDDHVGYAVRVVMGYCFPFGSTFGNMGELNTNLCRRQVVEGAVIVLIVFGAGFAIGYGVRAHISRRRKNRGW